MKRNLLMVALAAVLSVCASHAQEYTWKTTPVDASRTGCCSPSKDNVPQALGTVKGSKYIAPSGKAYKACSSTSKVAKAVLAAQERMSAVKDVIGYSTESMTARYPESALSDMLIDIIMNKTEELAGKEVHMGITNFGGIRADMPQGDIILDDMLSMFPFRNHLVYVEQTGKHIRAILEQMAATHFQVLGGVRVVAEGGKLLSVEIAGEPLEDDKVYGMATISFLLGGGDGLTLEQGALSLVHFSDVQIIDSVLEYIYAETAAGRPIEYRTDGRVIIKDLDK